MDDPPRTPAPRPSPEPRLAELWGEIRDLQAAEELLDWDQETYMPPGGQQARGRTAATLAGLRHRRLTSPELQEVLAACEEAAAAGPEGEVLAAQVHSARLDVDRAVRLPESLVQALARARSSCGAAWRQAREAADFGLLAAELRRLVGLKREEAAALAPEGGLYDALLQQFEPGATQAQLVPLFADLRRRLVPLVEAVRQTGRVIDESPARGRFDRSGQLAFGRGLAEALGFDFEHGRIDASTHPFCLGVDRTDVRLTWRYQEDDFRPAVFGILHETGHGLYEQGLPERWDRTPLGRHVSLGVHESQSRLWENHVGRSRGFWRWALPRFRETFPGAAAPDLDALWAALHTVKPSLIRVEADEATYNLHIVIRFELERALIAGDLEVDDLPGAWNDLYRELLGLVPPDDALGVLQDIHWPQGMFGYFPTYTLGTLAAAQLFAAAERDLGDLEEAFARGELRPLLGWLREKIHRAGSRWPAPELIERATGRPLGADDLMTHLETHAAAVYGVGAPGAA
jgi:carboxypeptidase Taq